MVSISFNSPPADESFPKCGGSFKAALTLFVLRSQISAAPGRWHHSPVFLFLHVSDRYTTGMPEVQSSLFFILPLPVFTLHLGRFSGWVTARWVTSDSLKTLHLWSFKKQTCLTQSAETILNQCPDALHILFSHWYILFIDSILMYGSPRLSK